MPIRRLAPDSKRNDSVPTISLVTWRDVEATGKDGLDRSATDRAAAVLAASARAGVAARRMAPARPQPHSGRRHLRLRVVPCARRVQLLVRRADLAGRDRRPAYT